MRPDRLALVAALLSLAAAPAGAASSRPRLAVLVVFDQAGSLEVDRYAALFGRGGFGGLDGGLDGAGARFDALYAYADTETGPGHATLATCANPDVHGVPANAWLENGKWRYVVDDDSAPVLGAPPGARGRGPAALLAPTLGDTMKADSHGRAKVVTVSAKDRAAILTGGRGADLAVWYDPAQGRYTTSEAYAKELPAWLADAGARLPHATLAGPTWTPLPIPPELSFLAPADDRPGEGGHDGLTRTFPHDFSTVPEAERQKLYPLMPHAMDDVFTLALDAVDHMALGADDEPDLLVVSVSTTDYIGHNFGPDSLEQLDVLRRGDLALRAFLDGLDRRLGRRRYVVAVTADHGAPPLPLPAESERWPHGIVVEKDVLAAARTAADGAMKDGGKRVLAFHPPSLFVDDAGLAPDVRARLRAAVAKAVEAVPGIARVYDFADRERRGPDVDSFEPLMRASFVPGRTASLFVRQKARVVFLHNEAKTGVDHGTPYVYDRRVPVFVAGPGVRRGRYAQPIDPRDVAPTLAFLLRVAPPDECQGKPVVAVGD